MIADTKKLQLQKDMIELVDLIIGPNMGELLTIETEILESSLVDSFGLLQLIADIELKFSVNIQTEDMTLENFSTINAMVALVTRYQKN